MWRVDEYGSDGKLVRQWPERYRDQEAADHWIRLQMTGEQLPDDHEMISVPEDTEDTPVNPWRDHVVVLAVFVVVVAVIVTVVCLVGYVNH